MSKLFADVSGRTLEPQHRQGSFAWEDPPRSRAPATSPVLAVAGFEGPLDWLLEMARTRRIDLARLSILALVEAFAGAMDTALTRVPDAPDARAPNLLAWAAWTVLATDLALLRSRLLLPAGAAEAHTALAEAEALRQQWVCRAEMAAAADWLERRPQLGSEAFARGRPEAARVEQAAVTEGRAVEDETGDGARVDPDRTPSDTADDLPVPGGDLTDLLRACLVALRLPPHAETYQPRQLPFWSISNAAGRITRLLNGLPQGADLGAFLPTIAQAGASRALHCRAAVAATLVAGLELTRSGALTLEQDAPRQPIQVRPCKPQ